MQASLEQEIFWRIHSGLPREAPGSEASTRRAFAMLPPLPDGARILDIGCGPGAQTLTLASASQASVVAVDNHLPFLEELTRRAAQSGLGQRIHALEASMFELDFETAFDLIWSEGAIYIMGFEEGLRQWRRLLKPGGYIGVTEISWIQPDAPEQALNFWQEAYPAMATVAQNLARLAAAGYRSLGHFTLPENDWWQNYYHPMAARIQSLREDYPDNPEAQRVLDLEQAEIELYRKYSAWYGYEFYLMQAA